jgi:hypothetical protein
MLHDDSSKSLYVTSQCTWLHAGSVRKHECSSPHCFLIKVRVATPYQITKYYKMCRSAYGRTMVGRLVGCLNVSRESFQLVTTLIEKDGFLFFMSSPFPDRLWGPFSIWTPGAFSLGVKRLSCNTNRSSRGFFRPPHVPYGLRCLPSRLWPKCNRLLRLGRPW